MPKHFFVLLVLVCVSCNPNPISYPEPKLDEATMTKVLIDVHLADGKLMLHPGSNPDSLATELYQSVFNKHQIKADDFQQSMNSLLLNPTRSKEVFKVVVDSLKAIQLRG